MPLRDGSVVTRDGSFRRVSLTFRGGQSAYGSVWSEPYCCKAFNMHAKAGCPEAFLKKSGALLELTCLPATRRTWCQASRDSAKAPDKRHIMDSLSGLFLISGGTAVTLHNLDVSSCHHLMLWRQLPRNIQASLSHLYTTKRVLIRCSTMHDLAR